MSQLFRIAVTLCAIAALFLVPFGMAQAQDAPVAVRTALIDSVSKGPDDGRFTIGAGDARLMYGYPIPFSTSHFVVRVGDQFATNSPTLRGGGSAVTYLSGERKATGSGSGTTEITFMFRGVRIIQRLVPVDGSFRRVSPDAFGQYFRVEYDVENLHDESLAVGLMLLIDTMIDDNDACQMDADNTRIQRETVFGGTRVPSEVLVYHRPGNRKGMMGVLMTDKGGTSKPDTMYVGRWPYFHGLVWDVSTGNAPYEDSAILLKWSATPVAPGTHRVFATHYGLPRPGQLRVMNDEKIETVETTVYFGPGGTGLTATSRRELAALTRGRTVHGAILTGHADAPGSDKMNMEISRRRVDAIRRYLVSRRIASRTIVPKYYGEVLADQDAVARRRGNAEDRKVDVVVFVGAD